MSARPRPDRPRLVYAAAALAILLIEIAIALLVKGGFVRHTLGDVLVVMLLYCALMAAFGLRPVIAALLAAGFAFAVEIAQAFDIVERLGLGGIPFARIVIGTTFSWTDLVAYAAGGALSLLCDAMLGKARSGRLKDQAS